MNSTNTQVKGDMLGKGVLGGKVLFPNNKYEGVELGQLVYISKFKFTGDQELEEMLYLLTKRCIIMRVVMVDNLKVALQILDTGLINSWGVHSRLYFCNYTPDYIRDTLLVRRDKIALVNEKVDPGIGKIETFGGDL